jgi:hypothetical protein
MKTLIHLFFLMLWIGIIHVFQIFIGQPLDVNQICRLSAIKQALLTKMLIVILQAFQILKNQTMIHDLFLDFFLCLEATDRIILLLKLMLFQLVIIHKLLLLDLLNLLRHNIYLIRY